MTDVNVLFFECNRLSKDAAEKTEIIWLKQVHESEMDNKEDDKLMLADSKQILKFWKRGYVALTISTTD